MNQQEANMDQGSENFPGKIAAVVLRMALHNGEQYLYVSPNIHRFLGYSHTVFEKGEKSIWKFIPPEHAEPLLKKWTNALKVADEFEADFPLVHRGGVSRWVHFQAVFTRALDRVLFADCAITRLDTFRHSQLEQSRFNALLRGIINTTPSIIFAKDMEGRFLFANKAMTRQYNIERKDILGKTDLDLSDTPDVAQRYRGEDFEVISSGKSLLFDSQVVGSKGIRYFQTIKSPLRSDAGEIVGIVGIATDVTHHTQTVEKLRQSEERQSLVSDFSRSLFGLLDEKEIIWHVIEHFLAKFSFEDCVYYHFRPADNTLVQCSGKWDGKLYQELENPMIISPGRGVIGRAAAQQCSILVNNTAEDSDYIAYLPNRKSELAIPLLNGDNLLGVMNFEAENEYFFDETLVLTLETICNVASLKIAEARAVAQMQDSRKGLDEILNAPEELIVLSLDNNLCYVAFNENHQKNIKRLYDADIKVGMSILEAISVEEDRLQFEQNARRALAGEQFLLTEEYGSEDRYRTYWEVQYYPRRNAHGEVTGMINFVRDVSVQVRTHYLAIENERKLSTIFNATNELMALLQNDNGTLRFMGVNRAFLEFFSGLGTHLSEETLLGRDYGPLIMRSGFFITGKEGDYKDFVNDLLGRTDSVSCIQQVEIDGRKRYLDIYYKPVNDENRITKQVIVSAKEITELVEANEKLREREHLLDSINRNMKDGIYRSTVDDKLIYHNKAMYELFGYTEEEAHTLHPSEYYAQPEDRTAIIEELKTRGNVQNREVLFKRKNGEVF
ncbi:MAG: PAS domain-containing protein [Flavobacteriales bacterium]|nr:PAS domain-containing protein [Flavobacteriales bacterium]